MSSTFLFLLHDVFQEFSNVMLIKQPFLSQRIGPKRAAHVLKLRQQCLDPFKDLRDLRTIRLGAHVGIRKDINVNMDRLQHATWVRTNPMIKSVNNDPSTLCPCEC